MKRHILLSALLIFFSINSIAQLSSTILPKSFEQDNLLIDRADIPLVHIKTQSNKNLLAQTEDKKGTPWQFGKNVSVDIDLKKAGIKLPVDGGFIFILRIKSESALSLNLNFSKYQVPGDAFLHVYSANKKQILGGFTDDNNQKDGIFATSLILSNEITLEYFEPENPNFEGILQIDRVTHGFRNVAEYSKSFNDSGDCNINVNCDDGLPWADEVRSVCAIVTNNSAFCTGTLINNVREDETPLFLTANHCYSDPSSWVFWFNWQSEECETGSRPSTNQRLSGATLKARSLNADFCLVQLNNIPPAEYGAFYAGWDRSNTQPESQVCIHHPSGDIKKISFDDTPANSTDYKPTPYLEHSHWEVKRWDRSTTTEPGSSGSPLFDQNHRIIGQLHGGWASCSNFTEDYFGKISHSWEGDGSEGNRLKDFLDPENTGALYMDGFDPNQPKLPYDLQLLSIVTPKQIIYSSSKISPSYIIMNRGSETLTSFIAYYTVGGVKIDEQDWTGTLLPGETLTIKFPEKEINYGTHNFTAYIAKPNGLDEDNIENNKLQRNFEILQQIFYDGFETDSLWQLSGEFEIGQPQTFPDCCNPPYAFTGSQILGSDLSGQGERPGNYEYNLLDKEYSAISPKISCRGFEDTELHFMQIVGVEEAVYDHLKLEIFNGETYKTIWENTDRINGGTWERKRINISEWADNREIQLRYSIGSTDDDITFCGWNIDDFAITGTPYIYKGENALTFPNPNLGNFQIAIPQSTGLAQIDVFNSIGKKVLNVEKEVPESNLISLNFSSLNKGLYIIRVKTSNGIHTAKTIIR